MADQGNWEPFFDALEKEKQLDVKAWSYETPKQNGWYWVKYHNYEFAEVVFLDLNLGIYIVGMDKPQNINRIYAWSSLLIPPVKINETRHK